MMRTSKEKVSDIVSTALSLVVLAFITAGVGGGGGSEETALSDRRRKKKPSQNTCKVNMEYSQVFQENFKNASYSNSRNEFYKITLFQLFATHWSRFQV